MTTLAEAGAAYNARTNGMVAAFEAAFAVKLAEFKALLRLASEKLGDTLIAGGNAGFIAAASAANTKAEEIVTLAGELRDLNDLAAGDVVTLL